MKLYELTEEFLKIEQHLEDAGGEMPTDLEERLEALEGALESKCESIGKLIANWRHESELIAAQAKVWADAAKGLNDKAKALDNKIARLKDYVIHELQKMDTPKLKTPSFSFTVKETPSVDITAEGLVPVDYIDYKPGISKDRLLRDLKNAHVIPGAALKYKRSLIIK